MTMNKSTGSACPEKVISYWVKVNNNLMNAPTIPCIPIDTHIGVNTDLKELKNGKFYIFKLRGTMIFRQVVFKKGRIYLEVLHPEFKDNYRQRITLTDIEKGLIEVEGQVVAYVLAPLYPDEEAIE